MRWKKPVPRPPTYWVPWFAWFPIVIENTSETVWLEWVWRHVEVNCDVAWKRYRTDVSWCGANLKHLKEDN